ncbi:MAG: helix-turn-helix transcriptional regulator [Aigarchaeota archaeon]|nr:helix-turn-helix transcriptional regulator [Aigarchaeota archaeon]
MKNRVRRFRVRSKLTQKDLADAVEVTRQTIIAVEKGRYDPSLRLALRLARFFGVPVEDLFLYSTRELSARSRQEGSRRPATNS